LELLIGFPFRAPHGYSNRKIQEMTSGGDWLNAGRLRGGLQVKSVYSGWRLQVAQGG
jgi:hypothetical protein